MGEVSVVGRWNQEFINRMRHASRNKPNLDEI
jgi:hypothetical protein